MATTLATNQPQTIIHKKAGQMVDKEFLELALRRCPTVSGYAIRDVSDGKTTLETDQYDRSVTIENMMLLNNQAKDYEAILYLANITQKDLVAIKDDVQPNTMVIRDANDPDDPGASIVSFCVEGDFPKFCNPESGHTDEWNFSQEIIIPMLEELFTDVDGDIGKFIAKLHKPSFEKNLMAHVGHRAMFVFLPLEGDPIIFGNNTLGGEFEWGSASQVHGFGTNANQEPIPIINAAVAAVKKFTLGPKTAITEDANGVHHVGNTKIVEAKKEELKASAAHKNKVAVTPPHGMEGTARNRWIRLFNNNKLPPNHLDKNLVLWVEPDAAPFAQKQNVVTIQDVKNLEDEIRTGNKAALPKDMGQGMKNAQAEIERANATGSYPPYSPVLTDSEMMSATATIAGFLDRDKVPSYLDIQKMEAKYGTFSEKLGIPLMDTTTWPEEDLYKLEKKALVKLLQQWRQYGIERTDVKDLIATAKVEKETEKHVAAKEILKPIKPNILFGKKAS